MPGKRILTILTILLGALAVCGLAGCGGDAEPVVLGAVYDLTGGQAELDLPSSRGARLAVDEANRAGGVLGRPVALELVDGRSDPETLRRVTGELLADEPGPVALLGLSDTDMVLAAAPVAAEHGRVFVTSGLGYDTVRLLLRAVGDAGSTDPEAMRRALAAGGTRLAAGIVPSDVPEP